MIIVIALIGAITAIAVPRLLDKKPQTRKLFREFTVAGKDLRNRAKLGNTTYRLAFKLGPGEQSWWVERSSIVTLIDKKKYELEREKAKSTFKDSDAPQSPFKPDTSIFKKEQSLPSGYRFVQIESGTQDIIVKEGLAYIHFFPQGLIEPSAIQITDPKKNIWTLVFNPITGQSDIIPEAKELKDLAR